MKLTRNRDPTNIILALKLILVDFCVIRHGQFLHCVFYSNFASIFKVISPVIRLTLYYCIMSQSIPTGYIPPGQPPGNCFERANPGHPGNVFCLIPCPGAKNDGRIPGVGAKFSQTRRNCSLFKLAKNPKKIKKTTRQYKFFIWRI